MTKEEKVRALSSLKVRSLRAHPNSVAQGSLLSDTESSLSEQTVFVMLVGADGADFWRQNIVLGEI
jgi:hypothetical protein